MTMIDPDTGAKRTDGEPLKTLRGYRLAPGRLHEVFKQSPILGVNMGVKETGIVLGSIVGTGRGMSESSENDAIEKAFGNISVNTRELRGLLQYR